MVGFWLIVGHLVGDYLLQCDWLAKNKANPHPGPEPGVRFLPDGSPVVPGDTPALLVALGDWRRRRAAWRLGHWACTAHCLLYTAGVWACTFTWMPWWGLLACFAAHWPVDRFGLPGRWMRNVSGQRGFAAASSPPNLPWGVIVVDNTLHLIVLGLIAAAAGVR